MTLREAFEEDIRIRKSGRTPTVYEGLCKIYYNECSCNTCPISNAVTGSRCIGNITTIVEQIYQDYLIACEVTGEEL